MDLVDGDGCVLRLAGGPPAHPVAVRPWEGLRAGNDGCAAGSRLARSRHGIRLLRKKLAMRADQFVLVTFAGAETRNEQFPDPSLPAQAHGVAPAVPAVEVADHGDTPGIRRPNGKAHARHAVDRHRSEEHTSELQSR